MFVFPCAHCKQPLSVPETVVGKKVRCPRCQGIAEAPSAAPVSSVAGPPSAALVPQPSRDVSWMDVWRNELRVPEVSLLSPRDDSRPPTSVDVSPPPVADGALDVRRLLAPPQGPDEIGRLGPYRVLKVLGAGGMGVVFQAEDLQLRRPVALKAILPGLASGAEARARFLREARAAAAVQHDHILTVYQVGEDRGVLFLAMPLLQGETLEDRLQREPHLPPRTVLRVGREIAEGLAAAHERQLVHRDIKPSNIWLEAGRDRVKILDFGLARGVGDDARVTHTGAVLGTPAYMAPEQARGEAADPRSDLFSLGCVLYRLCTAELPFKGKNTLATLSALALEEPPPVRQRNPAVPPPLADLVARLMAKDPARRPSSARAVADTIAVIEGSLSAVQPTGPPAVRPVTDVLPVADTATINLPEAIADSAPAEALPRWAVALVGDGVALLLLLSGLYFVVRTLIG